MNTIIAFLSSATFSRTHFFILFCLCKYASSFCLSPSLNFVLIYQSLSVSFIQLYFKLALYALLAFIFLTSFSLYCSTLSIFLSIILSIIFSFYLKLHSLSVNSSFYCCSLCLYTIQLPLYTILLFTILSIHHSIFLSIVLFFVYLPFIILYTFPLS